MSRDYDLIVVGGGWTGAVIATDACRNGLKTLVLEKGEITSLIGTDIFYKSRSPGLPAKRLPDPVQETFTLRHERTGQSFPMRTLGTFLAGRGLGGAGLMWGGISARFHPHGFTSKTHYGDLLQQPWAEDLDYRDWPIGYDDLEPHYTWAEAVLGVASTRGLPSENYKRSHSLPGKPLDLSPKLAHLAKAASEIGLTVTENPNALSLEPYTNPLGITRNVNPQHGYSLATPLNTLWPAAVATGNLDLRSGHVHRVLHSGGRANGVTYTDEHGGRQTVLAPMVALCSWTLNNVRLLLLSRIGKAYSPNEGGLVGRHYANHIGVSSQGFLPEPIFEEPSSKIAGWANSDFDPGRDKTANYVGGTRIQVTGLYNLQRELPTVPDNAPQWGTGWQKALKQHVGRAVSVAMLGEVAPHKHRYLDIDTTYRDAWGDPLLRLNFDWQPNDRNMVSAVGTTLDNILKQAGADVSKTGTQLPEHYDTVHCTNSHATGGAIMGSDPASSVVDSNLQSWDVRGLWVVGASAFPTSPAPNPTLTVIALAQRAAQSLVRQSANLSSSVTA
ncbi:GMC family oxidoreductase [Ochrobactrum soli]|uniref:Gluconate 2-dehydrogenase, membrane-bound, flavoprotein n=1 Tax=Ochrobactrum soli TaxID=2448455 RepID=A0A2P9HDN1_9HYPH|nr:GMC family oxidoreductase [[Ochrobactrum] soli]SPL62206.1 Gluconate 2-dehydrogenase, membrane-bound, flavoprotein [[Ochrobactrum] soli]